MRVAAAEHRMGPPLRWYMSLPLLAVLTAPFRVGSAAARTSRAPEETLEQEFTDPLTTLPQIVVRDSYSPATYGTRAQTNAVVVRPIIPRIPPNTLLPFVQLIRPTLLAVTIPSPRGGSRTEFGDMQLFDLAVLPWPNRKASGFLVGIGPTFVFPTATSTSAGQGAWQAGPALGAIYIGHPGLLIGFILQNPISFAYTSGTSRSQSTLTFQPIFALHLFDGWYLRSAEAAWVVNWRHHEPTVIPLSAGIGRTFLRPGLPPMSLFVTGQWTIYRQFAPVVPQATLNFGMTAAFPQFREW